MRDQPTKDSHTNTPPSGDVTVVYDGDCPFCQQYTRLLRLRETAGNVHLIDARSKDPIVSDIENRGFDLDYGMIVIIAERFYHGPEAMQVLAVLSTRKGWFNRFNYYVFRSERLSAILYPALRTGRNLVLRILGREPISGQSG